MVNADTKKGNGRERAQRALLAVLPRAARVRVPERDPAGDIVVGGRRLRIGWIGEGNLRDARSLIRARRRRPDVAAARRMSPGAREVLRDAGIGWVDEMGAAEIAVGTILVSRSGQPPKPQGRPARWTPAAMAVAEALLCGTKATVGATQAATGLSTGSCTNALRVLTGFGHLEAESPRGRNSGRRVVDPDRLLLAYAEAVEALREPLSLCVGVAWPDPVEGLISLGMGWQKRDVAWAATRGVAAAVIAPHLTEVGSADVYVEPDTIVGLEALALDSGLRPLAGGRLTLRPFPTVAVNRLAEEVRGLRVAPWPRVYADLRGTGVRGEEAAEHLYEVIRDR